MLRLSNKHLAEIRRHGEETYPQECCGILLGTCAAEVRSVKETVRCANADTEFPHNRYHIEPRDLVRSQRDARERGLEIIGFYHSHPDHPAQWSPADLEEAHWIGCSYVITSVNKGKAADTNSFVLAGTIEEDKAFAQEELVVA